MLFRAEFTWMGHKSFYLVEAETVEQATNALVEKKYEHLKDSDLPEVQYTKEDIAAQTWIESEPIKWEGRVAFISDAQGL